ncbi:uncharacterized protein NFIA_030040 [Aspergillus fischeri NRRL 181]|uniref:Uncharacterized protein n=1 Tax=Neosartorya fischeri (strain ATCC 1020 / DSM 3700 / CBS 544.65 / FGSC A1164 / JCM 1740 / NRRL 181 / WB 181) TaxID=331117 RepID=A1D9U1_NEOFI|nr:uncharacterized protein NFIA_030040 [Aspergillus fischeri NRRL 181]EAW20572.1 hypothetical protein NFIA_030040 [Aspergillus fischeri NRRL 181]
MDANAAAAAYATRRHQQGCRSTSCQTSVIAKDGMNRTTVSMRSTLPSGESIVLPFAAPDSLRAAFTDTEEEIAKNNIAVYVLFCIGEHNSDLPRGWRGLWKREFERIKAVDVKEGRGWMYSGDLFGGYKRWQDSLYEA